MLNKLLIVHKLPICRARNFQARIAQGKALCLLVHFPRLRAEQEEASPLAAQSGKQRGGKIHAAHLVVQRLAQNLSGGKYAPVPRQNQRSFSESLHKAAVFARGKHCVRVRDEHIAAVLRLHHAHGVFNGSRYVSVAVFYSKNVDFFHILLNTSPIFSCITRSASLSYGVSLRLTSTSLFPR